MGTDAGVAPDRVPPVDDTTAGALRQVQEACNASNPDKRLEPQKYGLETTLVASALVVYGD
jgi:hypothetical protein